MINALMSSNNFLSLETPKETGFHQSTRICLEKIREAMLHHRWQEAAEYMACYPQILEDTISGSAQQNKEVGLGLSVFVCLCVMQTVFSQHYLLLHIILQYSMNRQYYTQLNSFTVLQPKLISRDCKHFNIFINKVSVM